MLNFNDIHQVDLTERMEKSENPGILLSLNVHDLTYGAAKDFCILGGMVICLCADYEGALVINEKKYKFRKGSIAILPEKHIISFTGEVKSDSLLLIAVTTDYILNMPSPIDTNIFSYSRYIPVMTMSDGKYDDILSYFKFLNKETKEKSIYQNEIIRSIFYALILEISGEYEIQYDLHSGAEIQSNDLSDKFFHLLAVYYKESRTVKFYADKLNITPKYLSTAIKKMTGRPVLDWLHEAVLIEAKMLLKTTDLTVQEISDRLNFSSPSAFVQFFRKHTGTTPKKL